MAAELVTPVDELTGLPLPILPIEPQHGALFVRYNYHHHFHPRRSEALQDEGGLAMRYSRGQMLPRSLHRRYHDVFAGPSLAATEEEKFKACVLACAGHIPRRAIDLSNIAEPSEVNLTEAEFDRSGIGRNTFVERSQKPAHAWVIRGRIGRFFATYALKQELGHISERVIDEFLHTTSAERIKELGNFMLSEAVEVAVEPVVPLHLQIIHQGHSSPWFARRPSTVVRRFFSKDYFPAYHEELRKKLAA